MTGKFLLMVLCLCLSTFAQTIYFEGNVNDGSNNISGVWVDYTSNQCGIMGYEYFGSASTNSFGIYSGTIPSECPNLVITPTNKHYSEFQPTAHIFIFIPPPPAEIKGINFLAIE